MSPRVSILLPTHNKPHLLQYAIRSVLAQTIQDFELLVVGDGCTDDTAEVVKNFNDSRIVWYDLPKAPNFGYANRNIALRNAKGDFIAFQAHDDLWLQDHLELLLRAFQRPEVEIAYSRPLWVIPGAVIVPGIFNLDHRPTLDFFLDIGNQIPAGCFVHRRGCFDKYGYWNEQLPGAADWDMWKRILIGGGRRNFAYLDVPTCIHFKADWHNKSYDAAHRFPMWERFFENGQIPEILKVDSGDASSEQEAVWRRLSADQGEWLHAFRSAIREVLDTLALQGIAAPMGFQTPLERLLHNENQLNAIQNSFLWGIREKIVKIPLAKKLYAAIRPIFQKHD